MVDNVHMLWLGYPFGDSIFLGAYDGAWAAVGAAHDHAKASEAKRDYAGKLPPLQARVSAVEFAKKDTSAADIICVDFGDAHEIPYYVQTIPMNTVIEIA